MSQQQPVAEGHHSKVHEAVLVATLQGYLSVQVTFNGQLMAGLSVKFFKPGAKDALGTVETAANGIAKLDKTFPVGNYECQIENEPKTTISTVEDAANPFVIHLPVDTPYHELVHSKPVADLPDNPVFPVIDELGQGYLSVQVAFNETAMQGLTVKFFKLGDENLLGMTVTTASGIARLEQPYPPGNYECQIENESKTIVSTVEDGANPFVIHLPVDTPYHELVHSKPVADLPDNPVFPVIDELGQGYLSVQVTFNGQLMAGLSVKFFKPGAKDALGTVETAANGIAKLDKTFDPGNYECQIEAEAALVVSTVEDGANPFVIHLPVDTPYHELIHSQPALYLDDNPKLPEDSDLDKLQEVSE